MRPAVAARAPRRQQSAHRRSRASATSCTRPRCWPGRWTAARCEAAVRAYVADRFDQIELPARWLGQRERDRAEQMVDKLLSWLGDNPREQLAIEQEFDEPARGARGAGRPCCCAGGSTDSNATPRAGWSWSTSRPARARRAPTRRVVHPAARRLSGGGRGRRVRPRARNRAGRRSSAVGTATPGSARARPATARRRRGSGVGRRAGARGGGCDGGVDVPRRGQRVLPLLRGAHLVPDLRQGKAGDGVR